MNNCPRQDPAYRPTHLITRKPHLERDAVFLYLYALQSDESWRPLYSHMRKFILGFLFKILILLNIKFSLTVFGIHSAFVQFLA